MRLFIALFERQGSTPFPPPPKKRKLYLPEPEFVNLLGSPGIDFLLGGPERQPYLTYRPARLQAGGIDSLELMPRILKRLQIRAQSCVVEGGKGGRLIYVLARAAWEYEYVILMNVREAYTV